jgi:hypothetical protein
VAVLQITVRDLIGDLQAFLEDANTKAQLSTDPVKSIRNLEKVRTFSFAGHMPFPESTSSQDVLNALEPALHQDRQRSLWGATNPSITRVVGFQQFSDSTNGRSLNWYNSNEPLMQVILLLQVDGVPDEWFRVASKSVRWSRMLWRGQPTDTGYDHYTLSFGGIFATKDHLLEEVIFSPNPHHEQDLFFARNQWVKANYPLISSSPKPILDPIIKNEHISFPSYGKYVQHS